MLWSIQSRTGVRIPAPPPWSAGSELLPAFLFYRLLLEDPAHASATGSDEGEFAEVQCGTNVNGGWISPIRTSAIRHP